MDGTILAVVRDRAGNCCKYCHMPQSGHVLTFPVDQIIARQHGGETVLENLALSCVRCNSYKGPNIAGIDPNSKNLTRLFHPRQDRWREHFSLEAAMIYGLSSIGRTTVELFPMNHADYLALGQALIEEGAFPSQ